MIVDRNVVVPAPLTTTPGKRGAQASAQDRSAWLKEMEKQELTAWLSHPAMLRGHSVAVSPMMHAPVNPQPMRDDASAPGDTASGGLGATDHKSASMPDGAARPGSGQHRSADRDAGRIATTDSGWRHRGAGTESGEDRDTRASPEGGAVYQGGPSAPVQGEMAVAELSAAGQADGSSVGLPSQSSIPVAAIATSPTIIDAQVAPADVLPPMQLAAAVMAVLKVQAEVGGGGQALHVPIPVAAIAADPAITEPRLPGTELSRPLNTPAALAIAQRLPRPGMGGEPAEQGERSGRVQEPHAARKELVGDLGQAPPLRIHAMRTESGVRIWIGADEAAGLGGRQLLLATDEIRRLMRVQGMPLASLTYNGESLFDAEETPEESGGMQSPDSSALRMRAKGGIGPRTRT